MPILTHEIQALLHENAIPNHLIFYITPFYFYFTPNDVRKLEPESIERILSDGGWISNNQTGITRHDKNGVETHTYRADPLYTLRVREMANGDLVMYIRQSSDKLVLLSSSLRHIQAITLDVYISYRIILHRNYVLTLKMPLQIIAFDTRDLTISQIVISEQSNILHFYASEDRCIVFTDTECKVYVNRGVLDFQLECVVNHNYTDYRHVFTRNHLYRSSREVGLELFCNGQFKTILAPNECDWDYYPVHLADGNLCLFLHEPDNHGLYLVRPHTHKVVPLLEFEECVGVKLHVSEEGCLSFH